MVNDITPAITRRIISVLFATKSLHSTALMVTFTVTSIIAVRLTGSEASAGFPSTVSTVGRVVGAYPFGWMMDRVGRRLGLSVGFLVAIVGAAAGALAVLQGIYWIFLAGAFLIGMSKSATEQTRYIAAEVTPEGRRANAIALIVFSGTVGSLGGRLVMGMNERLTEVTGIPSLAGPWLLTVGLMVIAMLLNQVMLRPDPLLLGRQLAAREDGGELGQAHSARSMRQIFRIPNVLLAVTLMALAQIGMAVVMVVTPLHIDREGYGTLVISTALMLHTLGMFAFAAITGWLINRLGPLPVVWLGALLLAGAGLVGYYAGSLTSIYLAVFLLGLGWNLCYISGSKMLSDELISQERGRAQGISEMIVGMTAAVGMLASGSIYSQYGYSGANMLVLIVVVLMALSVTAALWVEARFGTASPESGRVTSK